jgi:hypothetical protein
MAWFGMSLRCAWSVRGGIALRFRGDNGVPPHTGVLTRSGEVTVHDQGFLALALNEAITRWTDQS